MASKKHHLEEPDVAIHWESLGSDQGNGPDRPWSWDNCLYGYVSAEHDEVLYIGKCQSTTVRQRYHARDKDKLFDFFENELGITDQDIYIIAGELDTELERDDALLSSVESLLIFSMEPLGNVQSTRSRNPLWENLVIDCVGDWPEAEPSRFTDDTQDTAGEGT